MNSVDQLDEALAEVAELEERYGLNDPLPVQYLAWARGVITGDMGWSGFRLRSALNRPGYLDELAVFQGASYFRVLGRGNRYGLSGRGLACAGIEHDCVRAWCDEVLAPGPDGQVAVPDPARATGDERDLSDQLGIAGSDGLVCCLELRAGWRGHVLLCADDCCSWSIPVRIFQTNSCTRRRQSSSIRSTVSVIWCHWTAPASSRGRASMVNAR